MATASTMNMPQSSSSRRSGVPSSAIGLVALLQEDDPLLVRGALQALVPVVDVQWHEIAPSLPDLEAMAEVADPESADVIVANAANAATSDVPRLASAVASRVFFHLQEPTQALRLALGAGPEHFDPHASASTSSPYVQCLVTAALDAYIQKQKHAQDSTLDIADDVAALPESELRTLVHRLLDAECQNGRYQHALGVAMEAHEYNLVETILQRAQYPHNLLQYTMASADQCSKALRGPLQRVVAQAWQAQLDTSMRSSTSSSSSRNTDGQPTVAYDLVQVYQKLGDAQAAAQVLIALASAHPPKQDQCLTALQIALDMIDTGDQAFCMAVSQGLEAKQAAEAEPPQAQSSSDSPLAKVQRILSGGLASELALSFLHKHCQADRTIMERLKNALEERSSGSRSSLLHTMAVTCHAYLYCGTTQDAFLRDYLDWMKKASNWAKFSATSSLGVVHASHISEAKQLLEPYLPSEPTDTSTVSSTGGYAEGGSLYALGLVHADPTSDASKRQEACEYLRNHLRRSHANQAISHGAALGVGLTSMGSHSLAVCQELKEVLDTDSAVAGEAAGLALGMVLVGSGAGNIDTPNLGQHKEELAELVVELKGYARETQHEKIIRGIAMGLALINFGQEEHADVCIEEMRSDRDPVMRYGSMYCLSLAYCGTGSNKAIRILLHTAVSDVNDDVRMAAVVGLAFVLYDTPERVPELVSLLLESFNPHVRYASCLAVGIAMAGSGDSAAVSLLEPMLDDMVDYVRQGALMGTAMIYMQCSDSSRKVRAFREKIATIPTEKHQTNLTKMGAILAQGILDAGGRNCALVLGANGVTKRQAAVGLALWLQHWHWYPLCHMFSLALTPTLTIGLNHEFKYPKSFAIVCNSKPSQFAYPKPIQEKKEEVKKRVETVTLSTTAKEKARLARKRAKEDDGSSSAMAVDDENDNAAATIADDGDKKPGDDGEKKDEDTPMEEDEKPKKKQREPEPTSFRLANPARITKAQSRVCQWDLEQRYRPIRISSSSSSKHNNNNGYRGVVMLTDSTPSADNTVDADLCEVRSPRLEPTGELPPPEPFVWTPPPATADDKSETEKKQE